VSSTGSARGKVILLGEHAVVYGVPALVLGIEQGAKAVVDEAACDQIAINGQRIPQADPLHDALKALRESLGAGPVALDLTLELPPGSGLGASAALGAATARAVAHLSAKEDTTSIVRAALSWERVFHGNPSGVDTAAALSGGVLRYVRGEEPVQLQVNAAIEVCVCIAGPSASTQAMVESVARIKAKRPDIFDKNLVAIKALVDNATSAVRLGDSKHLGQLLDLNHMLLSSWMLSTEDLERARELAREAGAYGSKLTGSGGGGAVIAVGPSDSILQTWKSNGLRCFSASTRT
jgi:mevalonate kinase